MSARKDLSAPKVKVIFICLSASLAAGSFAITSLKTQRPTTDLLSTGLSAARSNPAPRKKAKTMKVRNKVWRGAVFIGDECRLKAQGLPSCWASMLSSRMFLALNGGRTRSSFEKFAERGTDRLGPDFVAF